MPRGGAHMSWFVQSKAIGRSRVEADPLKNGRDMSNSEMVEVGFGSWVDEFGSDGQWTYRDDGHMSWSGQITATGYSWTCTGRQRNGRATCV